MLALALIVLSPLYAESLSSYDNTTGRPLTLLFGLLFLGPLYGCPALLMRESARRLGLGWPSILLMAAAFGITQAAVIDQSVFNSAYRDIDYWDEGRLPTLIQALDFAPAMALSFVVGHVVWSFAAPIAVIESLAGPRALRPWVRKRWLAVPAVLYLAAAWLINKDTRETEIDLATTAQWGTSLLVALALIAGALALKRRVAVPRKPPALWVVFFLSLGTATGYLLLPQTWPGFLGCVTLLGAVAVVLLRVGRGFTQRHVLAVAAGPVISMALFAFLITPPGDVAPAQKYAHNAVFLVGSVTLLYWAWRRAGATRPVAAPAADLGAPEPIR
ncbi:MAG TPA: hypothetical protein VFC19_10890 [Candidatus Limnocylindrales bacterium]|nr:hypothetical protein [Candidatus Limnocylindrales bacterium]